MSSQNYTYIGPYLEYTVKTVEVQESSCTSSTCPKSDSLYCSQCGKNLKTSQTTITRYYDEPEIVWYEDFDEDFFVACMENIIDGNDLHRKYIAIPNKGVFEDVDTENEGVKEIEKIDFDEQKLRLSTTFKTSINKLSEMCGSENVKIKFGIITYNM